MVNVTYVQPDGSSRQVDVAEGTSVMEGAIRNDIAGIVAECGGACVCATCHVIVDDAWYERLDPALETERAMLEGVADPQATSRLSCQIVLSDKSMDGLVVRVPATQG